MTTTEERLKKIADIGKHSQEQKMAQENDKNQWWVNIQAIIKKGYTGRVNKLVKIANTLSANHIHLGKSGAGYPGKDEFYSCGIHHELGFIVERGNVYLESYLPVAGVGIKGGGCDGNDLIINTNGDIIRGLPMQFSPDGEKIKIEKFLKEFDTFEKRVYDYVDSL